MNESSGRDPASRYPQRIKNLLEMGRLRLQSATREQVAAVWRKAVESARDATLEGLSIDGALRSAALGHDGLDDLVPDSIEVRALRKGSLYDPVLAGPDDRDHALAWMRRTLPLLRAALVDVDPALSDVLEEME